MDRVKIYAIVNPKTDEVFYIGASMHPEKRFAIHSIAGEWHPVTKKYKIVKQLAKEGLKPSLKILEECSIAEAGEREVYFINFYQLKQIKSPYPSVKKFSRSTWNEYFAKMDADRIYNEQRLARIPAIAKAFMNG